MLNKRELSIDYTIPSDPTLEKPYTQYKTFDPAVMVSVYILIQPAKEKQGCTRAATRLGDNNLACHTEEFVNPCNVT